MAALGAYLKKGLACPVAVTIFFVVTSVGLVGSAFVIEHFLGAQPCQMCWWQRYGHMAQGGLALMLLLLVLRQRVHWCVTYLLLGLAALANGLLAGWHVLVQRKVLAARGWEVTAYNTPANTADLLGQLQKAVIMPPCDKVDFTIFTLSLAEWNVLTMMGLLVVMTLAFYYTGRK